MWSEINRPTTWQDFAGNPGAIQKCKDWLKKFEQGRAGVPRVLVISGPEGCGKSLAADLLLKKAGYKTYRFSVNEIKNHKGDKNRLSNFCNLYAADLRKLGASKSRRQGHGIIVEDFDSLSRNDKKFTGTILELIKKQPSSVTPLIITTDNSRNHKISSSLLRIACHIRLTRLLERDLVKIAMRVAEAEHVYLNKDAAAIFAEYSYGDARQLLSQMEIFYVGRLDNTRVQLDDVVRFVENNRTESDEKQCKSFEGDLSSKQSDEERILGAAIGDRGDKRRKSEKDASLRSAADNSVQFAPLLFQAYPNCVLYKPDRPGESKKSVGLLADVAESFSIADVVKEQSWGEADHFELYSAYSIFRPIKMLRAAREKNDDSLSFTVSARGYQNFYGVDNSIKNQRKLQKALQSECIALNGLSVDELGITKILIGNLVETLSDDQLVDVLFDENERYRMHPDVLETLTRLKGGVTSEFTLTRARKKRLTKLFEGRIEEIPPATVKFVEAEVEQPKKDANDMFTVDW